MFNLKKDWMLEHRLGFLLFSLLLVVCFLINTVVAMQDVTTQEKWYLMLIPFDYTRLFQFSIFILMFYPLLALCGICPKSNAGLGSHIMTNQLAFTKKQLLWRGVKPWLTAYPTYIIFGTVLYAISQVYFSNQPLDGVLFKVGGTVGLACFVVGGIVLQIMGAVINSLAKQKRWYNVLSFILIRNFLYVISCILVTKVLQLDGNDEMIVFVWTMGFMVIFLGYSSVVFIKSFQQIEHIYQ